MDLTQAIENKERKLEQLQAEARKIEAELTTLKQALAIIQAGEAEEATAPAAVVSEPGTSPRFEMRSLNATAIRRQFP